VLTVTPNRPPAMKKSSEEPDFGATGQFELTGVYFVDKKADAAFATTLGMDRIKTLLLLGAGHAHLQVLTQLAANRRSDLDVTLVTPWSYQTYSSMTPGFVAGHYPLEDCQIDLQPLIREAGARWISARCTGLDANTQSIMLDYGGSSPGVDLHKTGISTNRPAMMTYDFLSIDTGSVMEKRTLDKAIPGAFEHAILVRPLEQFVNRWSQLLNKAKAHPDSPLRINMIGGGVSGVELVLAMHQGLQAAGLRAQFSLVAGGPVLAADFPKGTQKRLAQQLRNRQIEVHSNRCTRVHADRIELDDGRSLPSEYTFLATGSAAPEWLQHSGLAQDAEGYAQVNAHLQSTSHKNVFAAGDVASRVDRPQNKNGNRAKQAGADLALNLLASLTNQPLNAHNPSQHGVSFISCGDRTAIANWGGMSAEGAWAWRWKDKTDREFMARFRRG